MAIFTLHWYPLQMRNRRTEEQQVRDYAAKLYAILDPLVKPLEGVASEISRLERQQKSGVFLALLDLGRRRDHRQVRESDQEVAWPSACRITARV